MKKVCIQSGHGGVTTGQTGASGERDWTTKIAPMIADKLKGIVETYVCGGKANDDTKVTSTNWDLFLAIHYDADIYNDRGGFYDFPDPTADEVFETSKKLSTTLGEYYFKKTGIPLKLNRSNANTKFYYMWNYLTETTPCAILECGVGNRKPEDYETLRKYDFIAQTIADGILLALGLKDLQQDKIDELEKELDEMRESRDKWKELHNALEDKYKADFKSWTEQTKLLDRKIASQKIELENQMILYQDLEKKYEDEKVKVANALNLASWKQLVKALFRKRGDNNA